MKKLCLFFLCFCWILLLKAQPGETLPVYKQVQLKADQPDLLAQLMALGLSADHFHKSEDNKVELIFSEDELAILDAEGMDYEVMIPDMRAHYQALLASSSTETSNADCGLVNFDDGEMGGYHSFDDAVAHLFKMSTEYADIVQLESVGTSIENRPIWRVKISDNPMVDESDTESVVYFDALHHAREPMSLESILYYMWWLLENYDSDPEATYLVNNREMHFIPIVNPDGYVYNQLTDPNGGGFWRKNRRINGGGCFGVDLNRNYGFGWGLNTGSSSDACTDIYRGEAPFSEPESQAVRDVLANIQPEIAFSMHTFGDVFLSPFGFTDSLATYDLYAEFASEFIPETYRGYGTTAKMLGYTSSGTTRDYLHSEGTFAWAPEIGHSFWESPSVICNRVTEFLPTMKYLSWVSGNYACFHDAELMDTAPIWNGETFEFKIRVKNRGLRLNAENVQVVATTNNPAINALVDAVSYGNIASRSFADNADNPFRFEVIDDVSPGESIDFIVTVLQDGNIAYQDAFSFHAGEIVQIFNDDSEAGMDNWSTNGSQPWDTTFMDSYSGSHSIADSRYGNYLPQNESRVFNVNLIDLTTTTNPWLEYQAKWSLEPGSDLAYAQISLNNGLTWLFLSEYSESRHWTHERFDLSPFKDQANVRFRFLLVADDFLHSDGFYFDDFRIVDYQEPDMVPIENVNDRTFESTVFPNPGKLPQQVAIHTERAGVAKLTLTDLLGRVLHVEQKNLSNGLQFFPLPETGSGTFVLKIEFEGKTKVHRLIR